MRLDLTPKPFDHRDINQQFEIRTYQNGTFYALPVAGDGHPPKFLRRKGWEVYTTHSFKLNLQEAEGIHNSSLTQLPELDFPQLPKRSTPIITGRWYCPFVFVKERTSLKEQMQKSLFYELTLKKWWEKIYSGENDGGRCAVVISAKVKRLVTLVYGMEAEKENRDLDDGFVWFGVKGEFSKRKASVGLNLGVYEKLRWVQESRGWFDGGVSDVRVDGRREINSENGWTRFGCYVLVESFVFRKLDGSLLINFNFKNIDRIECKFE